MEQDNQKIINPHDLAKAFESDIKNVISEKFSVAPEAVKGGDTGWVEKGTLELFDNAFNLKVGQRSEVVKSPFGYHIYEVLDKKDSRTLTLDQSKERIIRGLIENHEQKMFDEWYTKELKAVRIFKNSNLIDALKVATELK